MTLWMGDGALKIEHFAEQKILIPGLDFALIFFAPCSIEGVVDRDVR